MGNFSQPCQEFLSRYRFIQMVSDYNFGNIKVYRKKQLNFDYVMVLDKYIPPESISQIRTQLKLIQQAFSQHHQQPNLLKIFHFQIFQKSLLECNLSLVRLYVEYYNYSLSELVKKRYGLGQQFSLNEIYYILNNAIQTYQVLLNINPNIFTCNLNSIFISPQGYLKFVPVQVRDFYQQENSFCKTLWYQTQRITTNFDKNHKKLTSEILKFIHEFIELLATYHPLTSKQLLYHHLIKLQRDLKTVKNINQLKKMIPQSQIKCLVVKKKESQTSQCNPTDTPPYSETNHYQNKKSMKKWAAK